MGAYWDEHWNCTIQGFRQWTMRCSRIPCVCLRLYMKSVFVCVLVFGTCVCMCTCIWNVFVSTLCSQGLRQYNAVLQDSTTGGPIDSPSALFPAPRLPLFLYFLLLSTAQWSRCQLGCSGSQNLPGSNYRRIICSCSYYMEHAKILI